MFTAGKVECEKCGRSCGISAVVDRRVVGIARLRVKEEWKRRNEWMNGRQKDVNKERKKRAKEKGEKVQRKNGTKSSPNSPTLTHIRKWHNCPKMSSCLYDHFPTSISFVKRILFVGCSNRCLFGNECFSSSESLGTIVSNKDLMGKTRFAVRQLEI